MFISETLTELTVYPSGAYGSKAKAKFSRLPSESHAASTMY